MVDMTDFASRYASAGSNEDPAAFASFYSKNGSFRINDGEVSEGREAIAETAASFMAAFPDMRVRLVEVVETDDFVEFHWHWTGTNNGPDGTGNSVDLKGFEQWTLSEDGLIQESRGSMDDAEYQRQLLAAPETEDQAMQNDAHSL